MDQVLLFLRDVGLQMKTSKGLLSILKEVSFNIKRSQVFGLVGESGCGKSMTALSVMRLLPQNAVVNGEILFEQTDLLKIPETSMRAVRGKDIAMIFQEPMTSLNPVLTVGYQIAEVLMTHEGMKKQDAFDRAVELMRAVKIPSPELRAKDYPHQLSGGMRQRVMIAMAIACNPKLLIADEPTTALDVTIQAQILSLLKGLREQIGMSMLLITHDLAVISEQADFASVMYLGRIVESAPVRELIQSPLHPYTRGLLNSLPSEKGKKLVPIKGFVPGPEKMPKGCKFYDRCPIAVAECNLQEPLLEQKAPDHLVRCIRV